MRSALLIAVLLPLSAAAQNAPTPPPEPAAPNFPPAPPQWPDRWVPQQSATLIVLNKIDAVSRQLSIPVGQQSGFQSLTIQVKACVVRPPDQPADAAAFLNISDSDANEPGFQGWTLANEPWVSMLQNPVYDVRVVGCG